MFESGEPAHVVSRFSDGVLKLYYDGYIIDETSEKKEPMVLILEVKEDTLVMAYTIQ